MSMSTGPSASPYYQPLNLTEFINPGGAADLGPGGTVYHECVCAVWQYTANLIPVTSVGTSALYLTNGLPTNGRAGALVYAAMQSDCTGVAPTTQTLWVQFYDPATGTWALHPEYPTGITLAIPAPPSAAVPVLGSATIKAVPAALRLGLSLTGANGYTGGHIYAVMQTWT